MLSSSHYRYRGVESSPPIRSKYTARITYRGRIYDEQQYCYPSPSGGILFIQTL